MKKEIENKNKNKEKLLKKRAADLCKRSRQITSGYLRQSQVTPHSYRWSPGLTRIRSQKNFEVKLSSKNHPKIKLEILYMFYTPIDTEKKILGMMVPMSNLMTSILSDFSKKIEQNSAYLNQKGPSFYGGNKQHPEFFYKLRQRLEVFKYSIGQPTDPRKRAIEHPKFFEIFFKIPVW